MSGKLKLSGAIVVGSFAASPSNPESGMIYYNTGSNQFEMYVNGSFVKTISQDDLDTIIGDIGNFSPSNYTPALTGSSVLNHLTGIDTALANAGGTVFSDADFRIQDNADATKELSFELSGITAGNTRTITAADGNVDLQEIIDLRTLTGLASGSADFGVFSGSTLTSSETLKNLLQELETAIELRALSSAVVLLDGSQAFTGDQSLGNNKLTNLAEPTNAQDAATKSYVDSSLEGLKPKEAVRVATDAAGTLATSFENGDTVDGVTLSTGDRILIKNQAAPEENGIYEVAATGAPTRASDFDSLSPIDEVNGAYVAVQEGTANEGKVFVQQGSVTTIGTDAINFVLFNSVSGLIGGDGITVSGSNISVTDGGITDAKIASGIDAVKLADGSVDNAEFQRLNGVTSNIQTQLDSKLENIVEDTTPELGGNLEVGANAIEAAANPVLLAGQDEVRRAKQASKSDYIAEEYIHAISLSASQTDTAIASLTFAHASIQAVHIDYILTEATSSDKKTGKLLLATNGTGVSLTDLSTETADTGITFNASINGANVEITYSSGSNGATMRADVKKFLA